MFHRVWNGTYEICSEPVGDDGVNLKGRVDNQELCSGTITPALPEVNMTSIRGMVACGKRGGASFFNRENSYKNHNWRIDPYTNRCEEGYEPCSNLTTYSETVCKAIGDDLSECPIIEIMMVS